MSPESNAHTAGAGNTSRSRRTRVRPGCTTGPTGLAGGGPDSSCITKGRGFGGVFLFGHLMPRRTALAVPAPASRAATSGDLRQNAGISDGVRLRACLRPRHARREASRATALCFESQRPGAWPTRSPPSRSRRNAASADGGTAGGQRKLGPDRSLPNKAFRQADVAIGKPAGLDVARSSRAVDGRDSCAATIAAYGRRSSWSSSQCRDACARHAWDLLRVICANGQDGLRLGPVVALGGTLTIPGLPASSDGSRFAPIRLRWGTVRLAPERPLPSPRGRLREPARTRRPLPHQLPGGLTVLARSQRRPPAPALCRQPEWRPAGQGYRQECSRSKPVDTVAQLARAILMCGIDCISRSSPLMAFRRGTSKRHCDWCQT